MCVILRLCGEHPDGALTVSSNKNKINVVFFSDASYVDRGFDAEFETIDSKDRKWPSLYQMMSLLFLNARSV